MLIQASQVKVPPFNVRFPSLFQITLLALYAANLHHVNLNQHLTCEILTPFSISRAKSEGSKILEVCYPLVLRSADPESPEVLLKWDPECFILERKLW